MRKRFCVVPLVAMVTLIGCNRNDADDAVATDDAAPAETVAEAEDAAAVGDAAFIADVAQANLMEIETSAIAETRAQRADVQEFARRMVADHTAANEELLKVAGTMPSSAMTANADTQSKIDGLRNADAAGFDRAYLDLQQAAHEKAVAMFERYDATGANPALDSFVSRTLPTLREHLERVRSLRSADAAPGAGTLEEDGTLPEETVPAEEATPPADDPTH